MLIILLLYHNIWIQATKNSVRRKGHMENVIENIKSRRSARRYTKQQINEDNLNIILECGRHAPSGGNSQFWHFTVIQNQDILLKLNQYVKLAFEKLKIDENTYKSIRAGKNLSAKDEYSFYYNAPTLIIVSNDSNYSNAMADSACALENMLLAANYLGLGACWINQLTWFDKDENVRKVLEELGIPNNYRVCGSMSLGYKDGPKSRGKVIKENTVTIIK